MLYSYFTKPMINKNDVQLTQEVRHTLGGIPVSRVTGNWDKNESNRSQTHTLGRMRVQCYTLKGQRITHK